jgi:hypothetical protein
MSGWVWSAGLGPLEHERVRGSRPRPSAWHTQKSPAPLQA